MLRSSNIINHTPVYIGHAHSLSAQAQGNTYCHVPYDVSKGEKKTMVLKNTLNKQKGEETNTENIFKFNYSEEGLIAGKSASSDSASSTLLSISFMHGL